MCAIVTVAGAVLTTVTALGFVVIVVIFTTLVVVGFALVIRVFSPDTVAAKEERGSSEIRRKGKSFIKEE